MYFVENPDADELEATADTFEDALVLALENSNGSNRVIAWGPGKNLPYRSIAYFSLLDPDAVALSEKGYRATVLRVLEPAYLPETFQPGAPPQKVDVFRVPFRVHSKLAPEVMRWPFAMDRTKVRGCEYPASIKDYVYGFRDTSWKNDVTDSITFGINGIGYTVHMQPMSILRWSEEGPTERYAMYRLMDTDEDHKLDLDVILGEREIDWDADSILETNSPAELLAAIVELARSEDPTVTRARMLDLEPTKRRASERREDDLYERAKLLQQEIANDDLTVNGRRRARRNPTPADLERAKEKFEEFHRHAPTKLFDAHTPIPARVRELGEAKFVLYSSKKNDPDTGLPVKNAIRYIHEHDTDGVGAYTPVKSGGVEVPAWIQKTTSVVILGKCLGYAWLDPKTKKERESKIRPYPDLCATPCGRALLVIQDRREVIAIIWGGGLGVEARGIVG